MLMRKTLLIYFGFVIACLVVIVTFITATTYTQLAVASLLYPPLIFFAYKVLPFNNDRGVSRKPATIHITTHHEKVSNSKTENVTVSDLDKRAFLKLIGVTGLSFFLISIFGRRIEAILFGQNLVPIPGSTNNPLVDKTSAAASPTEGYTISEIDDNIVGYYGFINNQGGWFIMKEDANNGTFRYTKGSSDFPGNWKRRENLSYDYFHNVFN